MKYCLLPLLLLTPITILFSQDTDYDEYLDDQEFEKLPWYGNNQFLYDFLDSIHYDENCLEDNNAYLHIPIKIWMYMDHDQGVFSRKAKTMVSELNYFFDLNNVGVRFYLHPGITVFTRDKYKQINYYTEAPRLTLKNKEKGVINVHVVNKLNKQILGLGGGNPRALYNSVTDAIVIEQDHFRSTLAHEVGHWLGLLHTHRNYNKGKCKQEAVKRDRKYDGCLKNGLICEKSGDGLCDTPAEPLLINRISDCKYTGNLTDEWGDKYNPSSTNIMSYHHEEGCRKNFTRGQIAIMLFIAFSKQEKEWLVSHNPGCHFDDYEYNNSFETPTIIKTKEVQYHSLHITYSGASEGITDTDYFRTSLPVKKRINLTLTVDPGFEEYVEVTIYNQLKKSMPAKKKQEKGKAVYTINLVKSQFLFFKVSDTRENGTSTIHYEIMF